MSKVSFSISLNLEELMMLEKMADEIGVSRSSMARILLRRGLAAARNADKGGTEKHDA